MKNQALNRTIEVNGLMEPKFTEEQKKEHRTERNRRKRFRQGRMTIRTFLGKN